MERMQSSADVKLNGIIQYIFENKFNTMKEIET